MQIIEDSRVKEKLYVEKLPNGLTVIREVFVFELNESLNVVNLFS